MLRAVIGNDEDLLGFTVTPRRMDNNKETWGKTWWLLHQTADDGTWLYCTVLNWKDHLTREEIYMETFQKCPK